MAVDFSLFDVMMSIVCAIVCGVVGAFIAVGILLLVEKIQYWLL